MEVHVCMENCEREYYITLEENILWQNQESTPRVNEVLEQKILDEFRTAKFEDVNEDLALAETDNFMFRKNTHEFEKNIIWVEPIDRTLQSSTIDF